MNKKPYEPEMVEMYPQYKMLPWIVGIASPLMIIYLLLGITSMLIISLIITIMYIDHNDPFGLGGVLPGWLCVFCYVDKIIDWLFK